MSFSRRYLEAALVAGKGGTPIFGLRVMAATRDALCRRLATLFPEAATAAACFAQAFGRPLYVHLARADKVAQAVSLLKAQQTGLWHVAADGSELERTAPHQAPRYDPASIRALADELARDDQAWRDWFIAEGIAPVRLAYEHLVQDPRAGVGAVLRGLGVNPSQPIVVEPRTARLADAQSADWISRFRAEHC